MLRQLNCFVGAFILITTSLFAASTSQRPSHPQHLTLLDWRIPSRIAANTAIRSLGEITTDQLIAIHNGPPCLVLTNGITKQSIPQYLRAFREQQQKTLNALQLPWNMASKKIMPESRSEDNQPLAQLKNMLAQHRRVVVTMYGGDLQYYGVIVLSLRTNAAGEDMVLVEGLASSLVTGDKNAYINDLISRFATWSGYHRCDPATIFDRKTLTADLVQAIKSNDAPAITRLIDAGADLFDASVERAVSDFVIAQAMQNLDNIKKTIDHALDVQQDLRYVGSIQKNINNRAELAFNPVILLQTYGAGNNLGGFFEHTFRFQVGDEKESLDANFVEGYLLRSIFRHRWYHATPQEREDYAKQMKISFEEVIIRTRAAKEIPPKKKIGWAIELVKADGREGERLWRKFIKTVTVEDLPMVQIEFFNWVPQRTVASTNIAKDWVWNGNRYTIVVRGTNEILGGVSTHIAIILLKASQGQNIGPRAVRQLQRLQKRGSSLQAEIDIWNIPSQKLFESVGFRAKEMGMNSYGITRRKVVEFTYQWKHDEAATKKRS